MIVWQYLAEGSDAMAKIRTFKRRNGETAAANRNAKIKGNTREFDRQGRTWEWGASSLVRLLALSLMLTTG